MASNKNDALQTRTVSGSVNLYDEQKCIGTSEDKRLAANIGGHSFNIVNQREELYFPNLRHDSHFVDRNNVPTMHWMDRRRKYPRDPRGLVKMSLEHPVDHPKVAQREQQRLEFRLAQIENPQSYHDFQARRRTLRPETPEARRTLNPSHKMPVEGKVTQCNSLTSRTEYMRRRDNHARSAPTLRAASLTRNNVEMRPEVAAHQLQTESGSYAHCKTASTYAMSMGTTLLGEQHRARQSRSSVQRCENYDFSVLKKNNSWSSEDKLLRSDPYYMKPKLAVTNNSVKYDIITNDRKNFFY